MLFYISFPLIWSFWIIWKLIKRNKKRLYTINDLDQLTGEEFEHALSHIFRNHGYRARVTKASGDYGADLLLEDKKGLIVVQAKRYSGNVGVEAVQEVVAAKAVYGAPRCMVVTNSYFTNNAIALAQANNVILIDRSDLIKML